MSHSSVVPAEIKSKTAKVRSLAWLEFVRENILWVILAALCIVLSFTIPTFMTARNLLNILRQVSMVGIVAVGMTFAMIGGSFDLSVGATMGLATVVVIQIQPVNVDHALMAVAMGILVGLAAGLLNGFIVGRIGTNSVVTTIGTMYVIWGMTLIYTQSRHVWVVGMYGPLAFLGTGSIGRFPVPILVFALAACLGQGILALTRFGRHLYATGGNIVAARFSGIDPGRVRTVAYLISGLMAAVAGIVMAARVQNVDPAFGIGTEFDVLTAVVLGGTSLFGGRGSVFGTVCGVLLLGVIANAMTLSGASYDVQLMAKGIVLVAAVSLNVVVRRQGA